MKQQKYLQFDMNTVFVLVLILVGQIFLLNGFYLFCCTAVLYLLFYFMQQVNKSAIFTLIAIYHVIQVTAGVLMCNYLGIDIDAKTATTSVATIASLTGIITLFLPIIYFQNKIPSISINGLKKYAEELSIEKTFYSYIVAFIICSFLSASAFTYSGLTQVIFSIVKIKWFLFLLFGYQSILKKKYQNIFYVFIFFEFASGFYSYFSDFKTVIFYLFVLYVSIFKKVVFQRFLTFALFVGAMIFLGIVWTNVKGEYRNYLNLGQSEQAVNVSAEDAGSKLYDLTNSVSDKSLNSSIYGFLERIQYTYHFALTLKRVPAILPHLNGRNLREALIFTTTPRILNPDKPVLEATVKTKKYTGLNYAGRKQGTSFSLGYFAEFYIDFGLYGMKIPLLLLGLLYGNIYYFLMRKSSRNFIFNYAVAGAFFMEFYSFEMDATFLMGRLFASFVTFIILIKYLFPALLRYIALPKRQKGFDKMDTN